MEKRKNEGNYIKLHPAKIQGADNIVLPSLSHQLDVPFFIWGNSEICFAIASQIPRFHHFNASDGNLFGKSAGKHLMLTVTKLSTAKLFTSLLRLATTPGTDWCSFSTSTHNVSNVVRGRRLSLRHSVKHYEAMDDKYVFISIYFQFLILYLQQEFFRCKEWQLTEFLEVALVVRNNDIAASSQCTLVLQHVFVVFYRCCQSFVKLWGITRKYYSYFLGLTNRMIAFFLCSMTKNIAHIGIRQVRCIKLYRPYLSQFNDGLCIFAFFAIFNKVHQDICIKKNLLHVQYPKRYLVLSSFISSDDRESSLTNSLVSFEIAKPLNFSAAVSSCLTVSASLIASCKKVTTMRISCGFMLRSRSAYGAIGVSEIFLANAVITKSL